jgi:hypothetical protein
MVIICYVTPFRLKLQPSQISLGTFRCHGALSPRRGSTLFRPDKMRKSASGHLSNSFRKYRNVYNVVSGSVCQPGPFVNITTSPTKFSTSFGPFGITFDSDQRHPPVLPISALGRPIHADSGNKSEEILLKQAEYMTDPTDFSEYH